MPGSDGGVGQVLKNAFSLIHFAPVAVFPDADGIPAADRGDEFAVRGKGQRHAGHSQILGRRTGRRNGAASRPVLHVPKAKAAVVESGHRLIVRRERQVIHRLLTQTRTAPRRAIGARRQWVAVEVGSRLSAGSMRRLSWRPPKGTGPRPTARNQGRERAGVEEPPECAGRIPTADDPCTIPAAASAVQGKGDLDLTRLGSRPYFLT